MRRGVKKEENERRGKLSKDGREKKMEVGNGGEGRAKMWEQEG